MSWSNEPAVPRAVRAPAPMAALARTLAPAAPAAALATALAAALTLGGCVAGPNFVPPAPPSVQTYTSGPLHELGGASSAAAAPRPAPAAASTPIQPAALQLDTALPLPARWWSVLDAPPLDATIAAALSGNRDLVAARERLAQAQEMVGVAEAALFPVIDLSATAGRVKYGAAFLGPEKLPPFTYYSVGPSVSYAFDVAGGLRRGVEQQRAVAQSQLEQLQAAALALSGNVTVQALVMASAQAQLDSLEAVLGDDRQNLKLVQDAFDAGGATRVDILNAQSQLANDQTLLPPLRRQLSLAQDALALLVGRAPGEWSAPHFRLAQFHLPDRLPLALPSELVQRRPDIQAAEARLHADTAAVGVAGADLYPQITLTASASLQSNLLQKLFNTGGMGAGLAGALTQPLFEHGALRAKQRAAIDEMHAALADYQQTVLSAFGQVADALESLDHDQELLVSEQAAAQTAASNLALTRESYAAGNSGVLQVLDAQRQDEQARLGLVRAEAQRLQDAAQLLLAIGGRIPAANFPPDSASG
jgi:NodT family efflux transporter outer membrane factor (OMF) lipoprotein